MTTEYTIKRIGRPETVVGTTYYGGVNRGKVMCWRMSPAEVIESSSSAVIVSENGTSYTVAEFFTDVVPWPAIEWEQSKP